LPGNTGENHQKPQSGDKKQPLPKYKSRALPPLLVCILMHVRFLIKVKMSLCLTKYHAMNMYPIFIKHQAFKTYGRMEVHIALMEVSVQLHALATSPPE
jgi:hypothetical protein